MKRAGGRRFYRPQDIAVLNGVRRLLHDEHYTIKGVQRLLKEGRGRLPAQRADLAAESVLENLRIVSARAEAMTSLTDTVFSGSTNVSWWLDCGQ